MGAPGPRGRPGCPTEIGHHKNPHQTVYTPMYRRRSIRLRGYDYFQTGAYDVPICVEDAPCLLGEVALSQRKMNDAARVSDRVWRSIPTQFLMAELDEHTVRRNHFPGIIKIVRCGLYGRPDAQRQTDGNKSGTPQRCRYIDFIIAYQVTGTIRPIVLGPKVPLRCSADGFIL